MRVPSPADHRLTVVLAAVAVALAAASIAVADFTSSAAAGPIALSSATLSAPGGVGAAQSNCRNNQPVHFSVSWSPTGSSFATGYSIRRATTSGGPYTTVGTVGIGTTSYLDADPALAYSTTYYYIVESTYQSWTAASSQASVTTLSKLCK